MNITALKFVWVFPASQSAVGLCVASASSSSESVDSDSTSSSDDEYGVGQKMKSQAVLATPAVRRLAMENKVCKHH